MNSYEMMYILRPDLGDEQTNGEVTKYRDFLSERGAASIEVQNRGRRRLAYPIQKFQEGVYVQVNYVADGSQIAPLERDMRLNEGVIRFLTLKVEEDIEPISPEQLAAAEAAQSGDAVEEVEVVEAAETTGEAVEEAPATEAAPTEPVASVEGEGEPEAPQPAAAE